MIFYVFLYLHISNGLKNWQNSAIIVHSLFFYYDDERSQLIVLKNFTYGMP